MLFTSLSFFFFLPLIFLLYWYIFNKKLKYQNILLLLASYFFYGWWNWKFVFLLGFSTLLDYLYGFGVASANRSKSKLFLYMSILNNMSILIIFKYYNFFVIESQNFFSSLGIIVNPFILNIALPIGISFYTFHGMSYVFDIYKGIRSPIRDFVSYALFVCFFPLLIAGPIERSNHLLPQVMRKRIFSYTQSVEGCRLIVWGLFKKLIIADGLAILVDTVFNTYQTQSASTLIVGAIGFSFQIYADFSGYTDIALGVAKLFGFELLSNFKFPYFSRNLAEFWRRWHISLTTWFRDYLYIPLGGSKNGKQTTIRNTFLVFIISGFWHGASWNFIVWGLIHAFGFLPLLLINRNRMYLDNTVAYKRKLPSIKEFFQMVFTFSFVTLAWIFFRLHDVNMGIDYVKRIIFGHQNFGDFISYKSVFFYSSLLIAADWYLRKDERILRVPKNTFIRYLLYFFIIFLIYFSIGKNNTSFIYFQF